MSDFLFRQPRVLLLTVVVIVAAGAAASVTLPRLEDPKTSTRMAFVIVRYPGADARIVESQVTEKVESRIREMPFVSAVDTWSMVGVSVALVRLADHARDVENAWSQLRDKLSDVAGELPSGAHPPEFDDSAWGAESLVLGLYWQHESPVDSAILLRLADELASRLRYTSGTKRIQMFGAGEEQILVEADPRQIAALHLTTSDIAHYVANSDPKVPAAPLQSHASELLVDITGEIDSLERVRQIPLTQEHSGGVVRLGDVANVSRSIKDPPSTMALIAGRPGIALGLRLTSDVRVDKWRAVVQREVDMFQSQLPASVGMHVLYDEAQHTNQRLGQLYWNFFASLILVAVVVVFMLGWKAVFPVCAGMPLTTMIVLAGMSWWGVSIDQMSVAGLILSMGLLIDNPLIIVDSVTEKLRAGHTPAVAVSQTVRSLWVPLLCSTLTTMLAFWPLLLMPGGVGEFLSNLGITVQLALTGSLLLSLTVVPTLAAFAHIWLSRLGGPKSGFGFTSRRLSAVYCETVRSSLGSPWRAILAATAFCCAGFLGGLFLEEQFFPPADRNEIPLTLRMPAQSSIARTAERAREARNRMLEHPQVADVHWFIGASAPKTHYSVIGTERAAPNYAQALVVLKDGRHSTRVVSEIQRLLDDSFPDVQAIASQIEQGPPPIAPIELRIYGPELSELQRLGDHARSVLAATPGVTHARQTLTADVPTLRLVVREDEVRLAGLTNESLVGQLAGNLRGIHGGSLLEANRELPVRVRLKGADQNGVSQLMSLQVLPDRADRSTASPLPISALADLRAEPEITSITRRNALRTNTVQGYIAAGISPIQVETAFRRSLEQQNFTLPAGYWTELGGVSAERKVAEGNLVAHFAVLAALMAASVVLAFNSFRMASLIVGVAVLSLGYGLGTLWLLDFPLGMTAIVGTMGMIGVAVNDSIVVLAAIRENDVARNGDRDAITHIVVSQTRHVWATTFTTVAGAVPLLWSGGQMWPPLAAVMIGGVTGATFVALHVIPSAYLLLLRVAARHEHTSIAAEFEPVQLANELNSHAFSDGGDVIQPEQAEHDLVLQR